MNINEWLLLARTPVVNDTENEMCRAQVIERLDRLEREVRRLNNAMRHLKSRKKMEGSHD